MQLVTNDFHSALTKFGINAMIFRIRRLCMGYPEVIRGQLKDFQANLQWQEVERVRASNKGLDPVAAYNQYYMCTLMDPPHALPVSKDEIDEVFAMHAYCSRWASVLALDHVGALRPVRGEIVDAVSGFF